MHSIHNVAAKDGAPLDIAQHQLPHHDAGHNTLQQHCNNLSFAEASPPAPDARSWPCLERDMCQQSGAHAAHVNSQPGLVHQAYSSDADDVLSVQHSPVHRLCRVAAEQNENKGLSTTERVFWGVGAKADAVEPCFVPLQLHTQAAVQRHLQASAAADTSHRTTMQQLQSRAADTAGLSAERQSAAQPPACSSPHSEVKAQNAGVAKAAAHARESAEAVQQANSMCTDSMRQVSTVTARVERVARQPRRRTLFAFVLAESA